MKSNEMNNKMENVVVTTSIIGCDKIVLAEQGKNLDKLINDKDESVRSAVARQGYGLDKLVSDPNEIVRTEARKQCGMNITR